MTTNSQLSITESKNKNKNNVFSKTTRIGTESQKWRSHRGLQWGGGGRRMGAKVQGIRSINGRYKIDRGRLRIVWEMEKPKICTTHEHELRGGNAGGRRGAGQRRIKGRKKWDNCNSMINKRY